MGNGARRSMLPVVVFCFSKKRVDALADNLSHLDLATSADKSEIQVRFPCLMKVLLNRLLTREGCHVKGYSTVLYSCMLHALH